MVFWLACGGFSLYYIITGYKGYEQKLIHSIDINFLLTTIMKSSSASSFKEVEVREKDAELSLSVKQHTSALRGYAYFNSLFFARHRRQLLQPGVLPPDRSGCHLCALRCLPASEPARRQ